MTDETRRRAVGRAAESEDFLGRWSRRKLAEGDPTPEAEPPLAQAMQSPEPVESGPEDLPTDADMPPIESLDEASDYRGFLSPRVSEELRRLALRKLFRSAAFNVRDGLDDYDEDMTSFAKLGDLVTREMRYRDALEEARRRLMADGDPESPAPVPDDEPSEQAAGEPEMADTSDQTGPTVGLDVGEEEPRV